MNRATALAIVIALWVVIYLPALGSTEIKGEEGRRILPAVTMIETDSWLVPFVGGEPFLRKPPLVNWAIAGMFKLTGIRNEWTARLPSALCVLVLGLMIVGTSGQGWMTVETALVAAIMAMTQVGLLAKAKFAGAEIEGIYAPLAGMAMVCWLAAWAKGVSPWRLWLVPAVFLGLGCLAKGPSLHLLFFYAVVIAVLGREGKWRALAHPAHFAGVALTAAIFAAWAIPYFRAPEATDAGKVWKRQGIDRFTSGDFNARDYVTNFPRALGDQLPWLLLAPACVGAWRKREGVSAWPVVVGLGVLLVPGALPRYVLPLGVPIALMLAESVSVLDESSPILRRWWLLNRGAAILLIACLCATPFAVSAGQHRGAALRAALLCGPLLALCAVIVARRGQSLRACGLAVASGALLGVASAIYALALVPFIVRGDDVRPVAAEIDAAIPAGEPLTIYNPGYLAAIFYLRTPYRYARGTADIPPEASWVLARGKARAQIESRRPDLRVVRTVKNSDGQELVLFHRQ